MDSESTEKLLSALAKMGIFERVQEVIAAGAADNEHSRNQVNRTEGSESGADLSGWLEAQHRHQHVKSAHTPVSVSQTHTERVVNSCITEFRASSAPRLSSLAMGRQRYKPC